MISLTGAVLHEVASNGKIACDNPTADERGNEGADTTDESVNF